MLSARRIARYAGPFVLSCSSCAPGTGGSRYDTPAVGGAPSSSGGSAGMVAGGQPGVGGGGVAGAASGSGGAPAGAGGSGGSTSAATGFVHREGTQLMLNGAPIMLEGISFGNEVWTNDEVPYQHHTEADFERLKSWGANAVRFYLNYSTLESDSQPYTYKQSGWEWIDQNIDWAKTHGIYLILNIHVPQGGFQPGPEGNALWDDTANQDRFVAMWKAIAQKYAGETIIAGYDLLNEPDVSSSAQQWEQLANRTIAEIRSVDTNHLLIVERTNAVNQAYYWDADMNFFLVNDDNVMYTFHFYGPFTYTHQYADWLGTGDGGGYPDAGRQESLDRGGSQHPRTKQYIEAALNQYVDFGAKHQVPLYLGEFGAIKHCFENGKGGDAYVSDVVSVAKSKGLHYTYHTYHEDNFGVFYGYGTPVNPASANFALIDVLDAAFE